MKRKQIMTVMITIVVLFAVYFIIGNPVVAYHNHKLKLAITSIEDKETVTLNEVVPFHWNIVYTFDPYTSKEEIQKTIGFSSNAIQESVSEEMVQLLFVRGETVVASVCGYANHLGYNIVFDGSVRFEENAAFTVSTASGFVELVEQ